MATNSYSGQARADLNPILNAIFASPDFCTAVTACAASGGGIDGASFNAGTNILTFTEGGAPQFTVDLTALAVDVNLASVGFNPATGVLTLTETDGQIHTVDIADALAVGDGLTGTGAAGTPLAVLIDPTSDPALTVSPAGVKLTAAAETPLTVTDTPTIDLTAGGTNGHDLTAAVKISATPGNVAITANPDGLAAAYTAAVSADAEQLLKLGTDQLPMLDPDDLVSADAGNLIVKGTDGKLHAAVAVPALADTNSVDLTDTAGTLSADLRIDTVSPGDVLLTVSADGVQGNVVIDPARGDAIVTSSAAGLKVEVVRDWTTGTAYLVNDLVYDAVSGNAYRATAAHTAGASLAADIANWVPLVASAENIYTDDGSLTADRTVTLNGHYLRMVGSNGAAYFFADGTARNSRWGLAPLTVSTPAALPLAAYAPDFSNNTAHRYVVNATSTGDVALTASTGLAYGELASIVVDNLRATDVNVTFDANYKDASGAAVTSIVVPAGERHAIVFAGENSSTATVLAGGGAPDTLYTADGTLTANRTVTLDYKTLTFDGANNNVVFDASGRPTSQRWGLSSPLVDIAPAGVIASRVVNFGDYQSVRIDIDPAATGDLTITGISGLTEGDTGVYGIVNSRATPLVVNLPNVIDVEGNPIASVTIPANGRGQISLIGYGGYATLVNPPAAAAVVETTLTVTDTDTVNLTAGGTNGHAISADVRIDTVTPGNVTLSSGANGIAAAFVETPETALTVTDTNTIDLTAGGTNGHAISADLRIDTITPGNVTFSSSANGLAAAVTFPADLRVVSITPAVTPGHYTATLSDASTFDVDLTALDEAPATAISPADTATGAVGTSALYAREDHAHPITIGLTAAGAAITMAVNAVTATLTPAAGTIQDTLGFDAAGDLVKQALTAANIYTGDGTLAANRTVTMGGRSLTFDGASNDVVIDTSGYPTSGRWGLISPVSTTVGAGAIPNQFLSFQDQTAHYITVGVAATGDLTVAAITDLQNGEFATYTIDNSRATPLNVNLPGTVTAGGVAVTSVTIPAASSYTLAFTKTTGGTGFELLNPPAGASTNLYNTDGSLTGNRIVDLNGHFLSIDGSVSALDIGQDGIPISDNFYRTAHVTTFGAGAIPAQTPDLYVMSNVSYIAPATSTGDLTITPTVSLGVGQIATINVRNERAGTLGVVFANGLGQDGAAIPAQTLAAGEERSYVVVGREQYSGGYTLIGVSSGSAPAGTLTIVTKTANYTTVAADQGSYIRFTAGVPTFHVPAAGEIGQQIIIRNATGAALTAIATGSTVNGSLTVSNTECLAMLCVAAGAWDAIGGI